MNISSVALFVLNICGLISCVINSLAHSLSSSFSFIVVGFVYDKSSSRNYLTLQG